MEFQSNYSDDSGAPIEFYVGRLVPRGLPRGEAGPGGADLRHRARIYVWALDEFAGPKFRLVGYEDGTDVTVQRAKKLAATLNSKASRFMVPSDFEDWYEELDEDERDRIMASSVRDNSKFR